MVIDIPEERVGTFARDIMLISAPCQNPFGEVEWIERPGGWWFGQRAAPRMMPLDGQSSSAFVSFFSDRGRTASTAHLAYIEGREASERAGKRPFRGFLFSAKAFCFAAVFLSAIHQ